MIANLLKSDSAAASKPEGSTSNASSSTVKALPTNVSPSPALGSTPFSNSAKPAAKTNSVAAAVAASSHDEDELYGVTDIVSFITGSNL